MKKTKRALITENLIQARLILRKISTPGESRTPNLLIRSQALYPIDYGCINSENKPCLHSRKHNQCETERN